MAIETKPTRRGNRAPAREIVSIETDVPRRRDLTPDEAEWFKLKSTSGVPSPSPEMIEIAKSYREFMSIRTKK